MKIGIKMSKRKAVQRNRWVVRLELILYFVCLLHDFLGVWRRFGDDVNVWKRNGQKLLFALKNFLFLAPMFDDVEREN